MGWGTPISFFSSRLLACPTRASSITPISLFFRLLACPTRATSIVSFKLKLPLYIVVWPLKMDVFIPDPSILGSDSLAALDSNARFLEDFSSCMPYFYCLLKGLHIPLASIALSTFSLGVSMCLPTKVIVRTGSTTCPCFLFFSPC